MEIKNLAGFVLSLVAVGMILGVGVLVFEKVADSGYLDEDVTNESFTTPTNQTTVRLTNGNITTWLGWIVNSSSVVYVSENVTIDLDAGTLNFTQNQSVCRAGNTCYTAYTWRQSETVTKSTLSSATTAISAIANTWLALIVTIVVLAIILTLVLRAFPRRQ